MIIRAALLTLGLSLISIRSASAFQSATPTSFGKRTARNEESIDRLSLAATSAKALPGTAKLDTPWEELGFEFRATNSHVRVTFKNDEWGEPELVPYIDLHIAATALHYGQSSFEGLKAFCHEDGEVYVFRPDENAKRMQSSCRRTMMPELPTEKFLESLQEVVKDNIEYVPPYGSGGALYIRPLLFGSGPRT
ncbi:MAG: hypothetical protein SGBAC_009217, partial [Bacillariaceae sp.]